MFLCIFSVVVRIDWRCHIGILLKEVLTFLTFSCITMLHTYPILSKCLRQTKYQTGLLFSQPVLIQKPSKIQWFCLCIFPFGYARNSWAQHFPPQWDIPKGIPDHNMCFSSTSTATRVLWPPGVLGWLLLAAGWSPSLWGWPLCLAGTISAKCSERLRKRIPARRSSQSVASLRTLSAWNIWSTSISLSGCYLRCSSCFSSTWRSSRSSVGSLTKRWRPAQRTPRNITGRSWVSPSPLPWFSSCLRSAGCPCTCATASAFSAPPATPLVPSPTLLYFLPMGTQPWTPLFTPSGLKNSGPHSCKSGTSIFAANWTRTWTILTTLTLPSRKSARVRLARSLQGWWSIKHPFHCPNGQIGPTSIVHNICSWTGQERPWANQGHYLLLALLMVSFGILGTVLALSLFFIFKVTHIYAFKGELYQQKAVKLSFIQIKRKSRSLWFYWRGFALLLSSRWFILYWPIATSNRI